MARPVTDSLPHSMTRALVGVDRREVAEARAGLEVLGRLAVDGDHALKRGILAARATRAHGAADPIAGAQAQRANELLVDKGVLVALHVVAGADPAVALVADLEDALDGDGSPRRARRPRRRPRRARPCARPRNPRPAQRPWRAAPRPSSPRARRARRTARPRNPADGGFATAALAVSGDDPAPWARGLEGCAPPRSPARRCRREERCWSACWAGRPSDATAPSLACRASGAATEASASATPPLSATPRALGGRGLALDRDGVPIGRARAAAAALGRPRGALRGGRARHRRQPRGRPSRAPSPRAPLSRTLPARTCAGARGGAWGGQGSPAASAAARAAASAARAASISALVRRFRRGLVTGGLRGRLGVRGRGGSHVIRHALSTSH